MHKIVSNYHNACQTLLVVMVMWIGTYFMSTGTQCSEPDNNSSLKSSSFDHASTSSFNLHVPYTSSFNPHVRKMSSFNPHVPKMSSFNPHVRSTSSTTAHIPASSQPLDNNVDKADPMVSVFVFSIFTVNTCEYS